MEWNIDIEIEIEVEFIVEISNILSVKEAFIFKNNKSK